jgi:hypothetical protein
MDIGRGRWHARAWAVCCGIGLAACGGGGGGADSGPTAGTPSASSGPPVVYEAPASAVAFRDPDTCPSGQTLDSAKKVCVAIDMCKSFGVCK